MGFLDDGSHVASTLILLFQKSHYYTNDKRLKKRLDKKSINNIYLELN